MTVYDTQNQDTRDEALEAAVETVRDGRLIVLPTDTVYGIGADAFTPEAVEALLEAKGRGRDAPPPVLIGDPAVVLALATDVPDYVEELTDAFWPGPLTLIVNAQPTLSWDLGETRGTVALRMPDDEVALDLLRRSGPLAVSSANRTGKPAATSVLDAATQLGDSVDVYLDGGPSSGGISSTIIDTTVEPPEILREGALSQEQIEAKVGNIFTAPEPEAADDEDAETEATEAAGADTEATDAAGTDTDAAGANADAAGADGGVPGAEAEIDASTRDSESAGPAGAESTGSRGSTDATSGTDVPEDRTDAPVATDAPVPAAAPAAADDVPVDTSETLNPPNPLDEAASVPRPDRAANPAAGGLDLPRENPAEDPARAAGDEGRTG